MADAFAILGFLVRCYYVYNDDYDKVVQELTFLGTSLEDLHWRFYQAYERIIKKK